MRSRAIGLLVFASALGPAAAPARAEPNGPIVITGISSRNVTPDNIVESTKDGVSDTGFIELRATAFEGSGDLRFGFPDGAEVDARISGPFRVSIITNRLDYLEPTPGCHSFTGLGDHERAFASVSGFFEQDMSYDGTTIVTKDFLVPPTDTFTLASVVAQASLAFTASGPDHEFCPELWGATVILDIRVTALPVRLPPPPPPPPPGQKDKPDRNALHWKTAADGDWSTDANWTPKDVPGERKKIFLDAAGPAYTPSGQATDSVFSLDVDKSVVTLPFDLRVANATQTTNFRVGLGATFTVSAALATFGGTIGDPGRGTTSVVHIADGGLWDSGDGVAVVGSKGKGRLEIDPQGDLTGKHLYVGGHSGDFGSVLLHGLANVTEVKIAAAPSSTAHVVLDGDATLTASALVLGDATGTNGLLGLGDDASATAGRSTAFVGTLSVGGDWSSGQGARRGGSGKVTVGAGALLHATTLAIGNARGRRNTSSVTADGSLGAGSGAPEVSATDALVVGGFAEGNLFVGNGAQVTATDMVVGDHGFVGVAFANNDPIPGAGLTAGELDLYGGALADVGVNGALTATVIRIGLEDDKRDGPAGDLPVVRTSRRNFPALDIAGPQSFHVTQSIFVGAGSSKPGYLNLDEAQAICDGMVVNSLGVVRIEDAVTIAVGSTGFLCDGTVKSDVTDTGVGMLTIDGSASFRASSRIVVPFTASGDPNKAPLVLTRSPARFAGDVVAEFTDFVPQRGQRFLLMHCGEPLNLTPGVDTFTVHTKLDVPGGFAFVLNTLSDGVELEVQ